MALYEVENLTYYYPGSSHRVLKDLNWRIKEGDFVILLGKSGCGKSTLLRALAGLLGDYYGGKIGGEIYFAGRPLSGMDKRWLARQVGMVGQNPEQQLVMTTVEKEVAFGLENLGLPPGEMRQRVAEVLTLLDLSQLKGAAVFNLSGGEKQKAVLAAVLARHPRVLLLDEAVSQLDPAAAQDFLQYIHRLNQEWGLTVVMVEQRLERCFSLADRIVILEDGQIAKEGPAGEMDLAQLGDYACYLPSVSRVFTGLNFPEIPLTVKEGRRLLQGLVSGQRVSGSGGGTVSPSPGEPVLKVEKVNFAYPRGPHCLKGVELELYPGQVTVILGENGAGKSTLLRNIVGLERPQRGKIYLSGVDITGRRPEELAVDIGYLSQNPADYLFNDTVREEIAFGLKVQNRYSAGRVDEVLFLLNLTTLGEVNPRDLSGGEQQRVALGTVLAPDPRVLLLDEPTRGMDPELKQQLEGIFSRLRERGKAIALVTHDVEFAAEVAQRVVIISGGEVMVKGSKEEVLSNSLYYSPQVNRLFRGINSRIVTLAEAREELSILTNEAG